MHNINVCINYTDSNEPCVRVLIEQYCHRSLYVHTDYYIIMRERELWEQGRSSSIGA